MASSNNTLVIGIGLQGKDKLPQQHCIIIIQTPNGINTTMQHNSPKHIQVEYLGVLSVILSGHFCCKQAAVLNEYSLVPTARVQCTASVTITVADSNNCQNSSPTSDAQLLRCSLLTQQMNAKQTVK